VLPPPLLFRVLLPCQFGFLTKIKCFSNVSNFRKPTTHTEKPIFLTPQTSFMFNLSRKSAIGLIFLKSHNYFLYVIICLSLVYLTGCSTPPAWIRLRGDNNNSGSSDNLLPGTKIIWTNSQGNFLSTAVFGSKGSLVYFNGINNQIIQADAKTGATLHSFTGGAAFDAPPVISDTYVIAGCEDGKLYNLNSSDLSLRWATAVNGKIFGSPFVSGGIYAGTDAGKFYSFDFGGNISWQFQAGGAITSSPLITNDGTIVFGSQDGYLYGLDQSGNLKWKTQLGGSIQASPAYSYKSDNIYIGSSNGTFYAVRPNGAISWSLPTGAAFTDRNSAAVVAGYFGGITDRVFFGNDNGDLYLYESNSTNVKAFIAKFSSSGRVFASPAVENNGTDAILCMYGRMLHLTVTKTPPGSPALFQFTTTSSVSFSDDGASILASPSINNDGTIFVSTNTGLRAIQ
jgi:outer membrane protein assembly factor BamB